LGAQESVTASDSSATSGPTAATAAGGSAQADFDTLIDLIIGTVQADSWQDNGTGEGQIMPFAINGVLIGPQHHLQTRADRDRQLAAVQAGSRRPARQPREASGAPSSDARQPSPLRYVSLPRLEAAIVHCQRNRQPLAEEMLTLAGLQRIAYVAIDAEARELVLAGPAGDWCPAPGGTLLSAETGRPISRLDDLLVLWRRQRQSRGQAFGCSIVPQQAALAATQRYVEAHAATPLEPGERGRWLAGLRDTLGAQDVQFFQIDGNSRVASVLLAADYHMKLVGMGLAKGVPGVRDYLSTVKLLPGGAAPPMSILRWWFAMPAVEVATNIAETVFAVPEGLVQVLSENELLAARGERVHTGASEELNRRFAASFTTHYDELSGMYPVYGELERIFELAMVVSLLEEHFLASRCGWQPQCLTDAERLRLPQVDVPETLQTVINHRVIGRQHVIAGVSGGVSIAVPRTTRATAGLEAPLAGFRARPRNTTATASASAPSSGQLDESSGAWWWDSPADPVSTPATGER
jgi:hypothetical protein